MPLDKARGTSIAGLYERRATQYSGKRVHFISRYLVREALAYAWQDPKLLQEWERQGVYHVLNGRTGQRMPIYYQMYRDFMAKREALDVGQAIRSLDKPLLIIHGGEDPSVPVEAARQLHRWKPDSKLHVIKGGNHVFGGSHPCEAGTLPEHAGELVETSLNFLKKLT